MREPFRRARALLPVARRPSPVARCPSPVQHNGGLFHAVSRRTPARCEGGYRAPMNNAMQSDPAVTGSFQRLLPKDLVQEAARAHSGRRDDMQVSWQPSLIGRFLELFAGRDRR